MADPCCVIGQELCARLRQLDAGYYATARPGRFSGVFARHVGQVLPWSDVARLYLEAQAARYAPHEILWIENVRTTHDHLMWFGALAPNGAALAEMQRAFREIVDREAHLHELWENLETRDLERAVGSVVYSWSPGSAFRGAETMSSRRPETRTG